MKTICTCGRKAICNCRRVNGRFVFEGEQVAIDLENDVQYVSMCLSATSRQSARSTPKKLLRGSNKLVYKAAVSNDTAAFLFYSRPTGAVHAAAQNMSLSVLFHPPKGRRSTDFHVCRPVPGDCRKQLIYQSEHFLHY